MAPGWVKLGTIVGLLANVAALAFTVALTAIGIWLAVSIADLRKTQDCVLMGRRDCARISVTPQG